MSSDEPDVSMIDPRSREVAEALLSLRSNRGWQIMLDEIDSSIVDCIDEQRSATYSDRPDCTAMVYRLAVRIDCLKWFKERMAALIINGTTPTEQERIEKGK
jgi:hypothetical protein